MQKKLALLLALLLIAINGFAQSFKLPIIVSDGTNQSILKIGTAVNGTDGYDQGLDVLAPPPPPSGAFDARLRENGTDYFTDIRDTNRTSKTYTLSYVAATGAGPITLKWDPSKLDSAWAYTITDDINGTSYHLDMKSRDSLDVSGSAYLKDGLRIIVSPVKRNQAPVIIQSIAAQKIQAGDNLTFNNLNNYFRDPDGDTLQYQVSSSDTSIVRAVVSNDSLRLAGQKPGQADLTVTANDGRGGSVQMQFKVSVQPNPIVISLPVTVGDGVHEQVLTLGMAPGATDGYDQGLDVLAPPPPPSGAFDARLSENGTDYFTDIRDTNRTSKTYTLSYTAATGAGPITLKWDPTKLDSAWAYTITDDINGTSYRLDMKSQVSLDVSGSAYLKDGLRIIVSPVKNQIDLKLSLQDINFKNVKPDSSKSKIVHLLNLGAVPIKIDSLRSSSSQFSWELSQKTIQPNDSTDLKINFRPDSLKSYSGKLGIIYNDSLDQQINLHGFGAAGLLTCRKVKISGSIVPGENDTLSFYVLNKGNANLVLKNDSLTNRYFKSLNTFPENILPGDSTKLIYSFAGQSLNIYSDTLYLNNNGLHSKVRFILRENLVKGALPSTVESVNFGAVSSNNFDMIVIPIWNASDKALHFSLKAFKDTSFFARVVSKSYLQKKVIAENVPDYSLAPHDTSYIALTFNPPNEGVFSDTLRIVVNTSLVRQVPVQGKGIKGFLQSDLKNMSVNFGPVTIGDSLKHTFNITNQSNSVVNITDIRHNNSAFHISLSSNTIGVNGKINASISFKPSQIVSYSDSLLISTNLGFTIGLALAGQGKIGTAISESRSQLPAKAKLFQNYPNPFNPTTIIRYGVPKLSMVQLIVYNILGQRVISLVSKQQSAGYYQVTLNANDLSSGLYLYRLEIGDKVITKKMILIK